MSSAGTGDSTPAVGGGIPPGRPAPDTAPAVNPMLAEVTTLVDWFRHPNNNVFDGMALTSLPANLVNCNPAAAMETVVSLEPTALLVFLGLLTS